MIDSSDLLDVPTALAPPAALPLFSLLTLFDRTYIESDFPGREQKIRAYQASEAVSAKFGAVTLGGIVTLLRSDADLLYVENGQSQTTGTGGSFNASIDLGNSITAGAAIGLTTTDTSIFRTIGGIASFGEYDSLTYSGSAFVSRFIPIGTQFYVQPSARFQYSETDSDSYTETTGIFNPEQTNTNGRVSAGGQAGVVLPAGQWAIIPNVEVFVNYDYDLPLFQTDRTGVDLKLGVNAIRGDLSFGASYQTLVARSDIKEFHSVRAFMSYNFPVAGAEAPIDIKNAPPVQAFDWTGFYVGANVGAGLLDNDCDSGCDGGDLSVPTFSDGTPASVNAVGGGFQDGGGDDASFVAGGQAGWNHQFQPGGGFVVGAEGDLQFTGFEDRYTGIGGFGAGGFVLADPVLPAVSIFPDGQGFGISPSTADLGIGTNPSNVALFRNASAGSDPTHEWFGTVRGRIGFAFDRFLPYATAGIALADGGRRENPGGFSNGASVPTDFFIGPASASNAASVRPSGGASKSDSVEFGYVVGGGVEYAFNDVLSAKVEGLYVDLGKNKGGSGGVVGVSNSGAPIATPAFEGRGRDDFVVLRGGINFKFSTY